MRALNVKDNQNRKVIGGLIVLCAKGVAEGSYFCDQMRLFYDGLILFLRVAVRVGAWFSPKLAAFVKGRISAFEMLRANVGAKPGPYIWVHCASLGEFEQGRPVIEEIRKSFPGYRVLLSFFSPSGYEVRKNYDAADVVSYLPWDTSKNARQWLSVVNPSLVIFVKYEYWHHYIAAIREREIPLLSISAIFRPNQIYFKWYGGFYRRILKKVNHFFVQNDDSERLLTSIGVNQHTLGGDTRFDRVMQIVSQAREINLAAEFSRGSVVLVAGSIWPDDFDALLPAMNEGQAKFIVAPHEISERFLTSMENALKVKHVRFSRAQVTDVSSYNVLFVDNVGMLSSLYRYGRYAFVGGGFREGLHNILEAACYGVPVCFGNKAYDVYQEANDLIAEKAAFAIADSQELRGTIQWLDQPDNYAHASSAARKYVVSRTGATEKILSYCNRLLK
ncbi:glycosyltransferase N-terminal domain-containing protein [Chryseolinea sp. T2]|uniref:3-deoxy-D-manno-octulosonic acid transferase n=1 Tax=Chryseolinea sp. T2 TaxID=3129255 RepID=UPI0030775E48